MKSAPREVPLTVRLSVSFYRFLLIAYPAAFRREYSTQMLQLFRDCSREIARTEGFFGLWRYLLSAFSDLVVSAVAERRQEEIRMSRAFWVRLGSLAGVIGGIIAGLSAAVALVVSVSQLLDQHSLLGFTLFPLQFAPQRLAPVLMLLFVLALIGLQAHGAQRAGVFGWIGITLAVAGEVIGSLGTSLQAIVINGQADACRTPLNCNFYDPNHFLLMGYSVALLGSLILATGMVFYGVVSLRCHLLARANGLPIIIGLLAIVNSAAGFIAPMFGTGTDYAGIEKIAIVLTVAPFAFAIMWVLLGLVIWPPRRVIVAQIAESRA
jgi:hypothetical protein